MSSQIDLGRVKRNVAKMVDMGAPEEDIDAYIGGEGTSIDAVKAFKGQAVSKTVEKDEKTLLGTVGAAIKAAGAGAIGTLSEVIDPTPMFGADRMDSPYRPNLDATKKAAAEVVDQQRAEYKPGFLGQATGMVTEVAANPLNYVGGSAKALASAGEKVAASGARKAVQAMTGGATSGFVQGVGTEDSRTANTAIGAVAAPVIEKAVDAAKGVVRAGREVSKGFTGKTAEQWQEVGAGLKETSQQTYKAMRDSGAVINKKTVNTLVDDLEKAVTANGKTNPDLHRNTLSVLNDLKALRNKPLGLEEADQYRQLLNDVVSSGTDGTGKINPDAMKALGLIDVLDDRIERLGNSNMAGGGAGAAQLLKQARQEWGRYRRFDKVSALVERYGDSPGVLKNQVRLLLQNKKAMRGFNETERDALKKLSQKGGVEGWLRLAGRAGIDLKNPSGNILPILVGGGATAAADVSTGGLLTAGATGARYASQALTRGQANEALGTLAGINTGQVAARAATAPRMTGGSVAAAANTLTRDAETATQDQPESVQPTASRPVAQPASSGTADEEGFEKRVYKDTRGIRTVGKGFNMQQSGARQIWEEAGIEVPFNDVLTGRDEISEEQADRLHDVMMEKVWNAAPRLLKGIENLSDNRQAVIRDMLYQLGEGEAKKFAPTFKLIEKGRFAEAAARLQKAKIASQSPNRVARNAYMLEHNVSRQDAEKALAATGKIKAKGRLYA